VCQKHIVDHENNKQLTSAAVPLKPKANVTLTLVTADSVDARWCFAVTHSSLTFVSVYQHTHTHTHTHQRLALT